jgi:uncharacterized peroxidase-related enzyme
VRALKTDPRGAELPAQDRALVDFAIQLTERPSEMERGDLERLKAAGFSEEQVLDIVLITSLFGFMNRLADGLGVELDPGMKQMVQKHADL